MNLLFFEKRRSPEKYHTYTGYNIKTLSPPVISISSNKTKNEIRMVAQ
jgi:hypothetical protein